MPIKVVIVMRTLASTLIHTFVACAAFGLAGAPLAGHAEDSLLRSSATSSLIQLPRPRLEGTTSVEAALAARRSVRSFTNKPVTLEELAQVLWAGQGITHPRGLRTAPSAGALYPLELFIIAGAVDGLPAGIYQYQPAGHGLVRIAQGDFRGALSDAALGQSPVRRAPLVVAVAADYQRTAVKYGDRAARYVHLEAGHAAQNICLQAAALGLGTVVIGAFSDQGVAAILRNAALQPLYLIPLGRK